MNGDFWQSILCFILDKRPNLEYFYITSAQNGLVTLKEVNYKTTNTIDYIDFTHPTQK